jgi:ABC-type phosphate/phosphonate transport system substrate-binding protein
MVIGRFAFVVVAASIGMDLLSVQGANAQTSPARFLTVDQDAKEFRADEILAQRLGKQLIGSPEQLSYEAVINALLDDARHDNKPLARTGGIVARVTPYAFVVAELRGAKVELLAACNSRTTGRTVINAFMVVPESPFNGANPTLEQVLDHLKMLSDTERPARFIYHNKYSTSSYFLPSLLFRTRRVFGSGSGDHTSNPEGVTSIAVERNASPNSADLIRAVATQPGGGETIASVWTGSKSAFEDPTSKSDMELAKKVRFVPIPADLPCDLLVATRKVDDKTKDAISAKLEKLQPIGPDAPGSNVNTWVQWSNVEAEGARRALSELRRQAGSSTLPVVVDVQSNQSSPVGGDLLDAARLAIRLAGTELLDKSQYFDYYKKSDIRWELERIHDGAVRLTVRYENFRLDSAEVTQQFDVSFQAPSDLTRRLVTLIHSRLHRIRPVCNDAAPTVLRDVEFDIATRVPFQEIQWYEPQRNDYRLEGESRVANVEKDETFEIQLAAAEFPRRPDNRSLDFEPMGRKAFRVLLMRVTPERTLFRALTIAFVLLLVAGAAALVWEAWRWRARQLALAIRDGGSSTPRHVPLASHGPVGDVALDGR